MLQSIIKGMVFMALVAIAISCRPKTDFPESGGEYNSPAAIIGTWKLNKAVQNDEGAISKNFPTKAKFLELTPLFSGLTKVVVSIGADSSFSVSNPDTSAGFYLPVGTGYRWRLIDPSSGPRYMKVYKRDNNVETETYRVDFGVPYRAAENKLSLRFARRNADGAAYLSYDYNFAR